MGTFSREAFKKGLLEHGIDLTDQEINQYLESKLQGNNLAKELSDISLTEDFYNVIEKWEGGDRASRHNNPGAHIWTPDLAEKFGAEKGDPFVGEDGRTYNTAKYNNIDQGKEASIFVTDSIMKRTRKSTGLDYDDPEFSAAFASNYAGLSIDDERVSNYSSDINSQIQRRYDESANALAGSGFPDLQQNPAQQITSAFDSIDYSMYDTPEQRNAALDFAGNALWQAVDTSFFGIPGWLDYEDTVQDFLTGEEGPSTFSGRVGAGLGGLAGFLGPMALVKGGARAAVSSGKYGAKTFTKKVAEEGSEYLAKGAGSPGKLKKTGGGYKKFRDMSNADQTNLFRKISDDVLENTTKFSQQSVDDAFALKLTQNSDGVIAAALKANKLPATSQNVAKIKEIVQKALVANGEKSVIPISSLHQRIAIALGGAQGSNKIANIASHLLEEGLMFAAVETPMEIFQSMNEEREMDLTGRAAHAFALGNALGLIRFMPGGKTWIGADGKQSSISREAFRKVRKMVSG